jgi:DNA polymerase-3 subunit epsilon
MKVVIFDLETTGVSVTQDRIIEIALHKGDLIQTNGEWEFVSERQLKQVCNPFTEDYVDDLGNRITELNPIVLELTGLQENLIRFFSPYFKDVAKTAETFIGDLPLVGYNIDNFDFPLLVREMERAGVKKVWKNPTIDALTLYRKLFPSTLSAVYERLTGREFQNAHRAMADVNATSEILCHLLKMQTPNELPEPEALMQSISGKRSDIDRKFKYDEKLGDWVFMFGKHRGKAVKQNLDYLKWMMMPDTDFHESTKQFAREIFFDEVAKQSGIPFAENNENE